MDYYAVRRSNLRRKMEKSGLDAMLVTNSLNVSYLTGFTGDDSWFYLDRECGVLISDPRYDIQIAEETSGIDPLIRPAGVSMVAAVSELISPPMKVGIEADSMTVAELSRLSKAVDGVWQPVGELVETLREVKDEFEIALIRESVRLAISGFEGLRRRLDPEMTEIEVRNELEWQMRGAGADESGFPVIAAAGLRAALPHAVPTSRRVREGDLLLIDWGAKKNMYVSDLTRVLITAKEPAAKLREVYQVVLNAQRAALKMIRPGITGDEADAAARKVIEEAGYGAAFNHGLGHGIGLFVHERGWLGRWSRTILKPGMVVTVEPGIYLPGRFGIRIEDDILITEEGNELLSDGFPKEFDEMILWK